MPHQITGARFLAERGFAFLCDAPGLGKTATVITAADAVGAERILVMPPAKVKNSWADEIEMWSTRRLPVEVIEGNVKSLRPGPGWFIASNANLANQQSCLAIAAGAPYDLIVADELRDFHEYQAARTRNLLAADGLWVCGKRFWALDGSPLVNSTSDFYPIFNGPMRGQASWMDFCTFFCAEMRPDTYKGVKPVGLKNAEQLALLLQPHTLRRTLKSVNIVLPPLMIEQTMFDMDPGALQQAMAGLENWTPQYLQQMLETQDELKDPAMARVRHALGLAKVPYVLQRIYALLMDGAGPLVVFFQHTAVQQQLSAHLRTSGVALDVIDGTVTRARGAAAKAAFQAGQLDVLLVQTQAGGMGLTLTRSNRALIAELPWTATAVEQAVKRIHRISQTRPCVAEVMRANGCWLEDALASVVGRKKRASDELMALLTTGA